MNTLILHKRSVRWSENHVFGANLIDTSLLQPTNFLQKYLKLNPYYNRYFDNFTPDLNPYYNKYFDNFTPDLDLVLWIRLWFSFGSW